MARGAGGCAVATLTTRREKEYAPAVEPRLRQCSAPVLRALLVVGALLGGCTSDPEYPNCENDRHCQRNGQPRVLRQSPLPAVPQPRRLRVRADLPPQPLRRGRQRLRRRQRLPRCQLCENHRCVARPECDATRACGTGRHCETGRCVADPTEDPTRSRNRGPQCTLEPPHFDFDDTQLSEATRAVLQRGAECIQRERTSRYVLIGRCDPRGTTEYNLALGERRARIVQRYMISLGVLPDRSPCRPRAPRAPRAPTRRGGARPPRGLPAAALKERGMKAPKRQGLFARGRLASSAPGCWVTSGRVRPRQAVGHGGPHPRAREPTTSSAGSSSSRPSTRPPRRCAPSTSSWSRPARRRATSPTSASRFEAMEERIRTLTGALDELRHRSTRRPPRAPRSPPASTPSSGAWASRPGRRVADPADNPAAVDHGPQAFDGRDYARARFLASALLHPRRAGPLADDAQLLVARASARREPRRHGGAGAQPTAADLPQRRRRARGPRDALEAFVNLRMCTEAQRTLRLLIERHGRTPPGTARAAAWTRGPRAAPRGLRRMSPGARAPPRRPLPLPSALAEKLGEGTLSEVWRATQEPLRARRRGEGAQALGGAGSQLGQRFEREGALLAGLSHQNIPQVTTRATTTRAGPSS
jgi:outer membrane protein OmpA-like peptidoglycan-associated protein